MFVVVLCLALWLVCLCLVLCGPSCWWHLLLVGFCGHQCMSAREWSVRSHLRWGLSVECSWCTVCSVVCLCRLFAIVNSRPRHTRCRNPINMTCSTLSTMPNEPCRKDKKGTFSVKCNLSILMGVMVTWLEPCYLIKL